jgi:serine/threonine protein kinase
MVDHQFQYTTENDIPLPDSIGRFKVIEFVSRNSGSQGSVYKAINPDNNTEVAIKVIGNSFQSYSQSLISALVGEDDMEQLRREAGILHTLDHPNIVKLLETGYDPEYGTYLIMEWISGGNIQSILDWYNVKKLSISLASKIIIKILEALEAAHKSGITHLDIKPHNILITEDEDVKLSDFGIAGNSKDKILAGRGTEGYMAPEQQDPNRINLVGPTSDIYSVGILLVKMLTGHLPRNRKDMEKILETMPKSLSKFIDSATKEDPSSRFQSAQDALRHFLTII